MSQFSRSLRINPDRLRSDFEALAEIGSTGDGGVHRPSFSDAHLAARAWFREQIAKAGLECRVDGAGNHSAILGCGPVDAPTLLLGSHLDSVPYGGRFDGALGVVSALEALRVVNEAHLDLAMNLEAIDFTDEESTLVGLTGSAAISGKLKAGDLQNPRGGRAALEAGLARAGLTDESMLSAARPPESLGGYLEVHIEQGKRLEKSGIKIGIVTTIVGICWYRLTFIGRADHAGTTAMSDRLDPAQGASAFTLAVREIVVQEFPRCVANVGSLIFAPGAFNIVPSSVAVLLEFRAPTEDEFGRLEAVLVQRARSEAEHLKLGLSVEFLGRHSPTPLSERVQQAFGQVCETLGLSHVPLVSYAGHDAQSLAHLCPVGMIFVPSVDGASHSPREFTEWEDCVNGANVLLQAAVHIAY